MAALMDLRLRDLGPNLFRRLDANLRARLVIPSALLIIAVLSGVVFAAVAIHRRELQVAQNERAQLIATLAAEAISRHMVEIGNRQLEALMEGLRSHGGINEVSVLDADGVVTRSANEEFVGRKAWPFPALEGGQSLTRVEGDSVAVVRPLLNEPRCGECHGYVSQVNGYVDLRFNNAEVVDASRRLATILVVAATIALVVLLTVTWLLLGREAVKPIQNLVAAMRRAEAGDTAVVADNGRADEFGIASRGFDDMITALNRSQAELQRVHEERMIKADRFAMIGQMATGLAHEIRNPLAGLSGALELLAEEMEDSPHRAEMIHEMQHQVTRLEGIMEGLLNFARPPKAQLRTTDVNTALSKALFLMGQRRYSKVAMVSELSAALPAVRADSGQLEQVFLNVCLNAYQAMGEAGGTLTVRSFVREDSVVVTLTDTGPGIPPEVRAAIFTPFFTTRTNGTGLGLAMSVRMLAQHGGLIEFDCPPGGGTVFSIVLPVESPPSRVAGASAATARAS